ncbi:E3 ubiquitin ligase family protein [Thermonema rossianum]|uniref:E3 ubiquitin ligase family protein n=1 Tax=Thermonema rossianum TaxID=55505 RepID=UPI00056EDA78|nr:E3 ubiquitin ligase family protein [Thermonema rossianum]
MIYIIIGVILLAVGGFLEYNRRRQLRRVLNIKYHQTSNIADIIATYKDISQSLGAGNYSQIVEVKGKAKAKSPLQSEFSKKAVVYCATTITREYETKVQKQDQEGKTYWATERRSEVVSRQENKLPFLIEDGSGEIEVNPEGAELHLIQSVDRFEREGEGEFFSYIAQNIGGSGNNKTLGFRYREWIIPVGAPLYVLGEAHDRDGYLRIGKPKDENESFIISTKTEEQLVKESEGSAKMSLAGAFVLGIIGIGLIIYGIVS